MIIRLRDVSLSTFVERLFRHPAPADDAKPWYSGKVEFEIEAEQQLRHLTEVFSAADSLPAQGLSHRQIEVGLWCILGGADSESFVSLLWNRSLPFDLRRDTIAALFELYDRLLAAAPHESIDFRHPDSSPRRFQTIDYMALALIVEAFVPANTTSSYDRTRVRGALLNVFSRLLNHPAPVAQYAALHGLGHLRSKKRVAVIDQYLAARREMDATQREYALDARSGTLL